ncbi:ABC transporter permease [Corynebacterium variabile]|uniref:ABC3 transporter permease C-terminal domain-containing protein n=1 Tax=Corynebacterium variabile TaxID=1727 RepID=A0A4Y4C5Q7_9CORY|nr:ABC transporter permease [Corynebacterium variabile]GEC87516.1 hypothetical protein CVA01_28300 [Corynebacterium variabile]
MWTLIRRSARVNTPQLMGATVAITAAIGMISAAAFWFTAGLTDPALASTSGQLVTISSSFIGIAALIAGLAVASTIATGIRERRRQYALLAAVGATSGRLRGVILLETMLLFVAAAPVGTLLGFVLAAATVPLLRGTGLVPDAYPPPFDAVSATGATAVMLVVAVVAAWSASRHALRGHAADAVRAAAIEEPTLGTGRRITALVVLAAGAASAAMPFALPGMIGVAFAAISTFLLITALALVGPVITATIATRARHLLPRNLLLALPLTNIRGFSRRLAAVLIPFALVAALGTVQLSTNAITDTAAREQLTAGLLADRVGPVTSPQDADTVHRIDGVDNVWVLGSVTGEVIEEDDDEELPFEIREPVTIATISGTADYTSVLAPGVTAGSLTALDGDDTVAVSADALFGTTTGIGDTIAVRTDSETRNRTIVAIYTSSLGFGDYLIDSPGAETGGTLLVGTAPGAADTVSSTAAAQGIDLQNSSDYATEMQGNGEALTSSVLLFALLAFALLAAVNTLISLIRGRRDEFDLLSLIGATRFTLVRTVTTETVIAVIFAIILGTATAVPAALGTGIALLDSWPSLPWSTLIALPIVLFATATVTAAIAVSQLIRRMSGTPHQ